ncbi:UDP-N-acetylglucosamine 1-carboxyvinyltransferase [Paenibacillus glycinis]|uniref:UDP-N-acetylglucosamine 1-carboxyvinyltransferase n=1 Tax=Paenibacillus glycinis TaxID=2697035 RepID=A0ABW9XS99_9BACL|nr:UDP-N-acetylglucosamine 1-carboxyvinyltransferase [Paenibacillus glycinis]NBD25528.1 UDP-N-acetylglucosamine 1-carboxyvinyltransferase [Paenibacillus glycinis]
MLVINGGKSLKGQMSFNGAKNSMQFLVTTALLTDGVIRLNRVPMIQDIHTLTQILLDINCDVKLDESNEYMEICSKKIVKSEISAEYGRKVRSCILFVPGLLHRFGEVTIPRPGGDKIGRRPLDTHFYVINKLGGHVIEKEDGYTFRATKLKATKLSLPFPSFTGTGFAMMLAAKIAGITIIENAAMEPELEDLACLLRNMNVKIDGVGTKTIVIEGHETLSGGQWEIMPDRLEVGTYIMAAIASRGEITVKASELKQIAYLCDLLSEGGADFVKDKEFVTISCIDQLRSKSIETNPYPSFPTDLQPQYMALMTQSAGNCRIVENLHDDRFLHVPYLRSMGADIEIMGQTAIVRGVTKLFGNNVVSQDIRGGASLVIAALAAEGETVIDGFYHIDRGYANLYTKLKNMGANIQVIEPISASLLEI